MAGHDETSRYMDPATGLTVTQWTDHSSNHLYFTNPGWFDGARMLVFTSDRSGKSELAVIDLTSGEQRLVTSCADGESVHPYQTAVDPVNERAFTWIANRLEMVDLGTGERQVLFQMAEGWRGIIPNVTADGRQVAFGMVQVSGQPEFKELFQAKPKSQILLHDIEARQTRVIHERQLWLGHVNTSPVDPHLITFCHEGPWTKVEHRVWGCDLVGRRVWKAGPEMIPPACIGHEYWLADGRRIAYHGHDRTPKPVLGIFDVITGEGVAFEQPVTTKHSHSLDGKLIVGDGSGAHPWILAWKLEPDGLRGPWKLCRHDGSWSEQRRHVHPRIAPDGRSVLFTSDRKGYPALYQVELPKDVEDLPRLQSAS